MTVVGTCQNLFFFLKKRKYEDGIPVQGIIEPPPCATCDLLKLERTSEQHSKRMIRTQHQVAILNKRVKDLFCRLSLLLLLLSWALLPHFD